VKLQGNQIQDKPSKLLVIFSFCSPDPLFSPPVQESKFGTHFFGEDDGHIYETDSVQNYNIEVSSKHAPRLEKLTGSTSSEKSATLQRCSDGRPPLDGFTLASHKLPQDKWFPPPVIPLDYSPAPTFKTEPPAAAQPSTSTTSSRSSNMTADEVSRALCLSLSFFFSHVFSLYLL
jgi:hypothetical protein